MTLNTLDGYLAWINTTNDNNVEISIFKNAIINKHWDIVELAIMRGILFIMQPQWVVDYWETFPGKIRDMILNHILDHLQQKEMPICIYKLHDVLAKYIQKFNKLYCTYFKSLNVNLDNLTVIKCIEMDVYDIYTCLTPNSKLKSLKACSTGFRAIYDNKVCIPSLEKLHLIITSKSKFQPFYIFANLRKLKMNCKQISLLDTLPYDKLKILELTNFIIREMPIEFDILKLTKCAIRCHIKADTIYLKNCTYLYMPEIRANTAIVDNYYPLLFCRNVYR